MTTALQSPEQRSDSSRRGRRQAAQANHRTPARDDGYPVLIRLPNLDPSSPSSAESDIGHQDDQAVSTSKEPDARPALEREADVNAESTPLRSSPKTPVAQHVLAIVWKAAIFVAAAVLLFLAYRVINGTGATNAPAVDDDLLTPSTTDAGALPSIEPTEGLPPIQELDPVELPAHEATDGVETSPEVPPVHSEVTSPVPPDLPIDQPMDQSRIPLPSTEAELPIGASEPAWDGDQHEAIPYEDTATRPWVESDAAPVNPTRPWAEGPVGGEPVPQDHLRDDGINYHPTGGGAGEYDYPQTTPDHWRRPNQSNRPVDNREWGREAAPLPREWMNDGYQATRPNYPGGARLQGDIEQPPLRRDDERNGSRLY